MPTTYKLIAYTTDNRIVMFPETFHDFGVAHDVYEMHDWQRRHGNRSHVRWYAVRELEDVSYGVAQIEREAFMDRQPDADKLTSDEYAELLGALSIARDKLRADGFSGNLTERVLNKLGGGCTPRTNGMEFRLTEPA